MHHPCQGAISHVKPETDCHIQMASGIGHLPPNRSRAALPRQRKIYRIIVVEILTCRQIDLKNGNCGATSPQPKIKIAICLGKPPGVNPPDRLVNSPCHQNAISTHRIASCGGRISRHGFKRPPSLLPAAVDRTTRRQGTERHDPAGIPVVPKCGCCRRVEETIFVQPKDELCALAKREFHAHVDAPGPPELSGPLEDCHLGKFRDDSPPGFVRGGIVDHENPRGLRPGGSEASRYATSKHWVSVVCGDNDNQCLTLPVHPRDTSAPGRGRHPPVDGAQIRGVPDQNCLRRRRMARG